MLRLRLKNSPKLTSIFNILLVNIIKYKKKIDLQTTILMKCSLCKNKQFLILVREYLSKNLDNQTKNNILKNTLSSLYKRDHIFEYDSTENDDSSCSDYDDSSVSDYIKKINRSIYKFNEYVHKYVILKKHKLVCKLKNYMQNS